MLRAWPRLREWRDDDREALGAHRHLTAAAAGWVERDRDRNELYRGSRLVASESLLGDPAVVLNAQESEFLTASMEQRAELDAVARRRTRRRWYVTAAMAVVAALALAASVVALRQRDRADAEAAEARQNAVLAADNATLAEARGGVRPGAPGRRVRAGTSRSSGRRGRSRPATGGGGHGRRRPPAARSASRRRRRAGRRPGGPPRRRGPPDQRLRVERQRAAPCAVEHWRRRGRRCPASTVRVS